MRRCKDQRGFTLAELMVVIVVIALLTLIIIPPILGRVEEAKGKMYIAEARATYIATQLIATEMSASGATDDKIVEEITSTNENSRLRILLAGDAQGTVIMNNKDILNGKIQSINYLEKKGVYLVNIKAGQTTTVTKFEDIGELMN